MTTAYNTTHGLSNTPTYDSWKMMLQRVNYPKDDPRYVNYGGRGIAVCERWLDYPTFLADMGERPSGMTLDRYPNGAGNYEPGNCRWATPHEQMVNSRAFKLFPEVITEIKRLRTTGMTLDAIATRMSLARGTISRALSGKDCSRRSS